MRISGQKVFTQLLILATAIVVSHGAANFILTPEKNIYAIKGRTAKLAWTYRVDERNTEFKPYSPEWFYNDLSIGSDNGFNGWKFQIFNKTCPRRLRIPTVRVSREDQATLVIKNTSHNDSGVYTCSLLLRTGHVLKKTTELIVTETPRFTMEPNTTTTVLENSNLSIKCEAVGPPTPNITWIDIAKGSNITGPGSKHLVINNVKRSYHGRKYKCLASNNPNEPPTETSTTIVVNYPPQFTKLPENTTVTEGQNITLHCQAIGNPTASILWSRENDLPLKTGFTKSNNGRTIVLPNANKSDAGKYICTAQNYLYKRLHPIKTFAFVTVKYPPTIVSNSNSVVANKSDTVNLKCTAHGNPAPTITWSKPPSSDSIHTGRLFNIKSVNKSDAGTYICTARNGIGMAKANIIVTVQYKPTIDKSASSTTAKSWNGHKITMRCKYSDANPAPMWTWKRSNGSFITVVKNIGSGSEVEITTGHDSSDYGLYKCKAKNVAGSDEHTINVTQLFAPGPPNVSVTNIEASTVTVRWTKPLDNGGSPVTGYKLEINGKSIDIKEPQRNQNVKELSKGEEYDVKLYAKNIAGLGIASNVTFRTKKQGPPAAPVITESTDVPPTSVKLTWEKPDENGGEITKYTIFQKVIGVDSEWKQVGQIYGSPLTYTVKNLEPGMTYQFIVTATNRFGNSVKDDSNAKEVFIPLTTKSTLAPIGTKPPKGKSSGSSDPNQPIIIAGAVVAVVLILVTVIISIIILKKKNIFGNGKRKRARTENAAYHNDVDSNDSSGRQAAVIDLGDASATYAAVDTSKKTKNKPKEIATYAAVDKSKKKKKPGEIIYAELADFNTNYTPAENRPVKYLETDYAEISQFQNQSEPEPTYANFPGRSKDYVNVLDI